MGRPQKNNVMRKRNQTIAIILCAAKLYRYHNCCGHFLSKILTQGPCPEVLEGNRTKDLSFPGKFSDLSAPTKPKVVEIELSIKFYDNSHKVPSVSIFVDSKFRLTLEQVDFFRS